VRCVLQRVSTAEVLVEGVSVGRIGRGWLVLLGVGQGDSEADARKLADKVVKMRMFPDADGKFNLSLLDVRGELLAVSQFTLYADTAKGRRPSFIGAADPEVASRLVERFVEAVRAFDVHVETGLFGSHMDVRIHNDGPVTILLSTDDREDKGSA
jgi:D-aminoacyl-tRNA deacylase